MLAATWTLAIATSVLALGGIATVLTWWAGRRSDRIRQLREREDDVQERTLERARKEFVKSDQATAVVVVGGILAALGYMIVSDIRDNSKKQT